MKQWSMALIAMLLILSLTACGAQRASEPIVSTEAEVTETLEDAVTEETLAPETDATNRSDGATAANDGAEKILIVYFSAANTSSVDVVSSATPRVDGTAATELLAQYIHELVGGDIARITVVTDYPEEYEATADQAKEEQDNDERPAFKLEVDPEEYDTIFIGYPIWWYRLPMIMNTFFDTYDLSGKTIIPFNTHAGSRDGGTYQTIANLEPDATVLEGLAIAGDRTDSAEDDVKSWITALDY